MCLLFFDSPWKLDIIFQPVYDFCNRIFIGSGGKNSVDDRAIVLENLRTIESNILSKLRHFVALENLEFDPFIISQLGKERKSLEMFLAMRFQIFCEALCG